MYAFFGAELLMPAADIYWYSGSSFTLCTLALIGSVLMYLSIPVFVICYKRLVKTKPRRAKGEGAEEPGSEDPMLAEGGEQAPYGTFSDSKAER